MPESKDNHYPEWPYTTNGWDTIKIVTQSYQGCLDTGYTVIFIEGPDPLFDLMTDTIGCKPYKVRIRNLADLYRVNPTIWFTKETLVDWGDGAQDYLPGILDTIEHTYTKTGTYRIHTAGLDVPHTQGPPVCKVTWYPDTTHGEKPITIHVVEPPAVNLETVDTVCVNQVFELYNFSDSTKYAKYRVEKREQDTIIIDSFNVVELSDKFTTSFSKEGKFKVLMFATEFLSSVPPQARCPWSDTVEVLVLKPTAKFDVDSVGYPFFKFPNYSEGADFYEWSIKWADGRTYDKVPFPVPFLTRDPSWFLDLKDDTGHFEVCLIARKITGTNLQGAPEICPDTICKPVNNIYQTKVIVPNVFTPNGDGANDFFKIDIEGELKYDLMIFNRWGTKVFISDNKDNQWNGKDMNDGGECPGGVYFFIFSYKLRGTEEVKTVNGTITILRKQ